eukprot:10533135-Lingulodinium_polyedra.AAC.1
MSSRPDWTAFSRKTRLISSVGWGRRESIATQSFVGSSSAQWHNGIQSGASYSGAHACPGQSLAREPSLAQ